MLLHGDWCSVNASVGAREGCRSYYGREGEGGIGRGYLWSGLSAGYRQEVKEGRTIKTIIASGAVVRTGGGNQEVV